VFAFALEIAVVEKSASKIAGITMIFLNFFITKCLSLELRIRLE
jgi:hypothetical protein